MRAEGLIASLGKDLMAASHAMEPYERCAQAIKRHYSALFVKVEGRLLLVRNGDTPWLCVLIEGPGKFKVAQNWRQSGPSLVDFVDYRSASDLAKELAELAAHRSPNA